MVVVKTHFDFWLNAKITRLFKSSTYVRSCKKYLLTHKISLYTKQTIQILSIVKFRCHISQIKSRHSPTITLVTPFKYLVLEPGMVRGSPNWPEFSRFYLIKSAVLKVVQRSLTICSIPLLWSRLLSFCPFRGVCIKVLKVVQRSAKYFCLALWSWALHKYPPLFRSYPSFINNHGGQDKIAELVHLHLSCLWAFDYDVLLTNFRNKKVNLFTQESWTQL